MIVITNPTPITNEISTIHSLFENGLELLHIRKPDFSEDEMRSYLSEIELKYYRQKMKSRLLSLKIGMQDHSIFMMEEII